MKRLIILMLVSYFFIGYAFAFCNPGQWTMLKAGAVMFISEDYLHDYLSGTRTLQQLINGRYALRVKNSKKVHLIASGTTRGQKYFYIEFIDAASGDTFSRVVLAGDLTCN